MGWRYFLYTLGAISLFIFIVRFFVFKFQETPKYLVYKGRDADAMQTLQYIAKFNKTTCALTLDVFQQLDAEENSADSSSGALLPSGDTKKRTLQSRARAELARYRLLFNSFRMARITILIWLTYIFDFSGFTIAGFYLPRILAIKNGAAHVSLRATYAAYVYTYAPGMAGVLLGALISRVPSMGRKWTMVVSSGLMGASIFLLSTVDTVAKNEGLFTMEYFFQSMFNAVLYGVTPQLFPAAIRGTACGVASFWGRLFGIVSPLIAQHLYGRVGDATGAGDVNAVLYLAGGATMGCVLTIALLPAAMESEDERL